MNATDALQVVTQGMGTQMTHRLFGKHAEEAMRAVRAESIRLENKLSRFKPDSEISQVNAHAGAGEVSISSESWELLTLAARISKLEQRCFAVTVGPMVDLWNCSHAVSSPPEERIEALLPLINDGDVQLNADTGSASLRQEGQSIDLGGIGKGYAGDKLLAVCRSYGLSSALTNIGGNVAALGARPDGAMWQVGIRHPRHDNRLIAAVSVVDQSVVTSGDYQRFFWDRSGIRRHHLLDPASGYPAQAGLVSVTVVAGNGAEADALSTLLFVAGMERGIEVLHQVPGVEAVFVDTAMRVYYTQGLKGRLQAEAGIKAICLHQ
jgi:thiamine biosynthesis lipoprotein